MKFNDLNIKAKKSNKRVGRGISAGQGKTAGRGTKGQKSRTGARAKPGFSGGQNPLMQQLPKLPGFRSYHTKPETVYTGQLDAFAGKIVDAKLLADAGLVSNPYLTVKLLKKGEVTKKATVKLPLASKEAIAAVQSVGGTFEAISRLQRQTTKKPSKE